MNKDTTNTNYSYNEGKPLRLQRPMTSCTGCEGCKDRKVLLGKKPCVMLITEKEKEIVVSVHDNV